tara:strand:- start:47 stop:193 length:147 start_codon:yes stop_codon:yes gene_type:complete
LPNNIGCINTFYFQLALYGIQDKFGAGEAIRGNESDLHVNDIVVAPGI